MPYKCAESEGAEDPNQNRASFCLSRVCLSGLSDEVRDDSLAIYVDVCALSARDLEQANGTFKKIPRDITLLCLGRFTGRVTLIFVITPRYSRNIKVDD